MPPSTADEAQQAWREATFQLPSHRAADLLRMSALYRLLRWPGQVLVSDAEIARLAAFKDMNEHDFIQQFTRLRHDRRGLVLQEKSDGSCVFPPTDFHTAPLAGNRIIIIGCLGYPNARKPRITPVFALDPTAQPCGLMGAWCAGRFRTRLTNELKSKRQSSANGGTAYCGPWHL